MGEDRLTRRLAVGAEVLANGEVSFRVWAPKRKRVEVVLDAASGGREAIALRKEESGYFCASARGVGSSAQYRFRLDDDPVRYPDPASRFQPDGPHGSSQVVDASVFAWTDQDWRGVPTEGKVLYELHVGTFTPEGTWRAASAELEVLAELGINVIELMPVAEFPGRFGWGYDGVDLFAPTRLYGTPDAFRSFVDRAHALGIGVILDVVYNHFGPDGCYLRAFSDTYFTDRYDNEWGDAIDFDGPDAAPVREFFLANARHWTEEYHLDGLRLDATQQMFDSSAEHIVAAIAREVRETAGERRTFIVCENEPQDVRLVRPAAAGGYGTDALWNDDFHRAAIVALTGRNEAYYSDYSGTPQELISSVRWGYLYQGQRYKWQKKRRGTNAFDLQPGAFIHYLQNHDQVANSAFGERVHELTSPARYRALTALLLLAPQTPMLFQGQEFASSAPFLYFADHGPALGAAVRKGRAEFLSQFPSIGATTTRDVLPDPGAWKTFERCKLDHSERQRHSQAYALHSDLLRLRREDPVFSRPGAAKLHGAVVGLQAFALRFFGSDKHERLLLLNLGVALSLESAPEPLLAAPSERGWRMLWSSEALAYGGSSMPAPESDAGWYLPGESAVVLEPQ
jgi:maltooligosyltrehalose trehalohydrolase